MRTLRGECLDHILPLSARHLGSVLAEFVSYHNQDRPNDRSVWRLQCPAGCQLSKDMVSRPVLGGLRYVYEPAG